jgi:hypothetical protein
MTAARPRWRLAIPGALRSSFAGSLDKTLRVWRLPDGISVSEPLLRHDYWLTSALGARPD